MDFGLTHGEQELHKKNGILRWGTLPPQWHVDGRCGLDVETSLQRTTVWCGIWAGEGISSSLHTTVTIAETWFLTNLWVKIFFCLNKVRLVTHPVKKIESKTYPQKLSLCVKSEIACPIMGFYALWLFLTALVINPQLLDTRLSMKSSISMNSQVAVVRH